MKYDENSIILKYGLMMMFVCIMFVYVNSAFADDNILAETYQNQTKIVIQKELSTDIVKRTALIDYIYQQLKFDREFVESNIVFSQYEQTDILSDKLEIDAIIYECTSTVTVVAERIVGTTNNTEIIDAITSPGFIQKAQISKSIILYSDPPNDLTIKVRIEEEGTKFQMMFCGERTSMILKTKKENEIISQISRISGLDKEQITSVWKFEDLTKYTAPKENYVPPMTPDEIKKAAENTVKQAEKQMQTAESGIQKATDGGCLIATATYGSELAPQVQQLRELRDNKLLQTASGTSFMSGFNQFYYSFSPTIADWERENPVFKEFVKIILTPMISSLSILHYVDMDSESSVLGYGISLILLNVGMYFVAPSVVIYKIRNSSRFKNHM